MPTVKQLQADLKKRGLDTKGKKAELEARLAEDDAKKEAPEEAAPEEAAAGGGDDAAAEELAAAEAAAAKADRKSVV